MIAIDQDELCKSCDRDRDRCEGSGCNEARSSYIEDNRLVEDDPQIFEDLKYGDTIYLIKGDNLIADKVKSIYRNKNELTIETETVSGREVKPQATAMPEKKMYVQKQHALTAYENLMHVTMKRMMKNIIEFEKIK